jgi:hypothetical protein
MNPCRRCFGFINYNAVWIINTCYFVRLAHFGHFIIGLAGPLAFTAGPTISALWFPPEQRTTATAISTVSGFAGSAGCFIFGLCNFLCVTFSCLCESVPKLA